VQSGGEELEWKTRRSRVDPKLHDLGWMIVPFKPDLDLPLLTAHAVTEYPTENGPAVIRFRSLSLPALSACDRDCSLDRSVSLA
jgi:hypothetical protein